MIIGLSGYARTGKDVAAEVLVNEYGFKRVAFADKLREFVYALNPIIVGEFENQEYWNMVRSGLSVSSQWLPYRKHYSYVQTVIDEFGWDNYKETPWGTEIRRLLQRVGTEAGREILCKDIWVHAALDGIDSDDNIVITDARFPNEAKQVWLAGGLMWRINRFGVGPVNDHPSEVGLDNWKFDKIVINDSTLGDFQEKVREAYESCL